ncbi:hypothetical protein LWI29_026840 [Acer saccharum]|uniref:Uncharacterized protein n=1 Tax=Acer saccharum TaxID=4024 RepID=A0AA39RYX3_ACESA|nr:hypothetical protein LWI29_026840 [Acer saccharum]
MVNVEGPNVPTDVEGTKLPTGVGPNVSTGSRPGLEAQDSLLATLPIDSPINSLSVGVSAGAGADVLSKSILPTITVSSTQ